MKVSNYVCSLQTCGWYPSRLPKQHARRYKTGSHLRHPFLHCLHSPIFLFYNRTNSNKWDSRIKWGDGGFASSIPRIWLHPESDCASSSCAGALPVSGMPGRHFWWQWQQEVNALYRSCADPGLVLWWCILYTARSTLENKAGEPCGVAQVLWDSLGLAANN